MHIYDLLAPELHKTRADRDVFQLCLREDKANPKAIPKDLDCSVKYDGLFVIAAVARKSNYEKGKITLFARSGQELTNQEHLYIPQNVQDAILESPRDLYQFELQSTDLRNSVFNGAISPKRVKPLDPDTAAKLCKNKMWLTDIIPTSDFIDYPFLPRWERRGAINKLARDYDLLLPEWRTLHYPEMIKWADELIATGEEGVVGYNTLGCYTPGARRADLAIKKAKEIRMDLRCVAVRPGKKGKRLGMAEGLDIQYGDKVIKADLGEGWTDIMRVDILRNQHEAIGHIFEVYAFDKSELGVLRQPKVGMRRDDKTTPDEV